ncbi:ankyrin repeat domain-containing protein 16-like isoform X2 [Lethenteron reissneri]|uniref:ankyrin repeat domain-containing protein 16-like isoform X2 n=1 Tax=Lethenteron reissneri TaxID=7753 RepID=UPI002AB6B587|nr:ankyrin repeat domain-containing protein 16-like isoform X2 [Lethenteron reissneri]
MSPAEDDEYFFKLAQESDDAAAVALSIHLQQLQQQRPRELSDGTHVATSGATTVATTGATEATATAGLSRLASLRRGSARDSLLHYAGRLGRPRLLALLLAPPLGADPEAANREHKRALHEAAAGGHGPCVRLLLRHGARVDSLKRADWTPLMMACTRAGSLDVVRELLAHGASLSVRNKDGWSALHVACRTGDSAVVGALLDASPAAWDTRSSVGRTPLHTAAMHGNLEVTQMLLDRCAFVPDGRDSCGVTPFVDAVRHGHLDVARLLLEKHQEGHVSAIETLRSLGADLHATDAKGRTALHVACAAQRAECVRALRAAGLLNAEDAEGRTPLSLAQKPPVVSAMEEPS